MGQSVYPEPSVTSSGEMVDGVQSFGGAEMHRVFLVFKMLASNTLIRCYILCSDSVFLNTCPTTSPTM